MTRTLPSLVIALLLLSSGCGSFWSSSKKTEDEPFKPSATKGNSDLVFVRTGDRRYYYVIDRKRRACFFHAPMYGKKHLAELDCQKLPEFEEIAGPAPRHDPPRVARRAPRHRPVAPPPATAPPPEPAAPPAATPHAGEPDPSAPGSLSNETRERFRRAYVQHFCARRAGADEPLEVILSRHRLTPSQWSAAKTEFSADRVLWQALTTEAMESCP